MTASSTISEAEPVLEARDIHVEYRLPTIRSTTLKEYLLNKLNGRGHSTTTHALKGVSLTARQGECIALVGHNGCGKSTFLKVLAGILKPVRGTLSVKGRVAPLIELGAGFDPELTGRENVYLSCALMGLTRREIDERMDTIINFAELDAFFDAPVKTYSSGMYMRLGFACTTAIDAELLLIDEILAVGDENFQKKCVQKMHDTRKSGVTIVIVSHDLGVVERMADRALVIHHGSLAFEGNPKEAVEFYRELMEQERLDRLPAAEREEELRKRRLEKNDTVALAHVATEARIVSVRTADRTATERAELPAGQPWQLEIEVEVKRPFQKPPVVGFAIHSEQGVRLFGGNTRVHPLAEGVSDALATEGFHRVTFAFDSLPLASGDYVIVAAIHDHNLEATVDLIGDAGRLRVSDAADPHNFDRDLLASTTRSVQARLGP